MISPKLFSQINNKTKRVIAIISNKDLFMIDPYEFHDSRIVQLALTKKYDILRTHTF